MAMNVSVVEGDYVVVSSLLRVQQVLCLWTENQFAYSLYESSVLTERREGVIHPFDFSQGQQGFQSERPRSAAHG